MTLAMGMELYYGRGIDLLPRLSDVREQFASLSVFAQKGYEKVAG